MNGSNKKYLVFFRLLMLPVTGAGCNWIVMRFSSSTQCRCTSIQSWRSSHLHRHSAPVHGLLLLLLAPFFNINEALAYSSLTLTCGTALDQEASFLSDSHRRESCCHPDALLSSPRFLPPAESPACQHSRAHARRRLFTESSF